MLNFTVFGEVKAKQSVKIGRNGIKYTPADVKHYANEVRNSFLQAYPFWKAEWITDKNVKMFIRIYLSIPKSFSKKKTQEAIIGAIRPTVRPDCDNIAKNICDALNGIAYPDDKQIVHLLVTKEYTDGAERAEIEIEVDEMCRDERLIRGLKG